MVQTRILNKLCDLFVLLVTELHREANKLRSDSLFSLFSNSLLIELVYNTREE